MNIQRSSVDLTQSSLGRPHYGDEPIHADVVIERGIFKGFNYIISRGRGPWYCGYVRVRELNFDPFGAFSDTRWEVSYRDARPEWPFVWIGFDCHHLHDGYSPELIRPEDKPLDPDFFDPIGLPPTLDGVRLNIFAIIDELINKGVKP